MQGDAGRKNVYIKDLRRVSIAESAKTTPGRLLLNHSFQSSTAMRFQSFALVGLLSGSALAVPKASKRSDPENSGQPINNANGRGAPLLGKATLLSCLVSLCLSIFYNRWNE
jgi:hypothetical protein